jgi:flagellar motor switch protein FliG
MSRRSQWVAGLLAGIVLFGILWLAMAGRKEVTVPLDTGALSSTDLAAARGMLADRGISCKLTSGRLLVPAKHLAAAREIVASLAKPREDAAESLMALAREDDIWRTSAQNDKRWQAAKMVALSRLVETFPSVASATVLYEPGGPRGLGGAGQEPTAAVRVAMKSGATLTHSVALAIAELVSGSIAGMSYRHVRVVDGSGRSYRFDSEPGGDTALQRRREIETYYHEKIHTALSYIDKVVIAVSATGKDDPAAALAVSVAVPRSYLAALGQTARGDPSAADGALAKIRQAVLAVAADKPCQVKADWYYDTEPAALMDATASGGGAFGWGGVLAVAIIASAGGAGSALWANRIVRRRSDHVEQEQSGAESVEDNARGRETQEPDRPWDFLKNLTTDEIVSLVASEHPQTVAIVLGQLEPAKAAAVLTGLSEETQAAVARRVTVLHHVSPVVVVEVGRTLADRAANLAKGQPPAAGVEGRVAEILRHAGYATEKVVLDALAGQSPSLVEAIRRRMFSFEDIAQLPVDRLRPAMAHVDTAELAVALRTAGEDVQAKIFSAMPSEAARRVREEMERMGPVRLIEVEAAQQRVAEAVRRAESGEYLSESARRERQLLA